MASAQTGMGMVRAVPVCMSESTVASFNSANKWLLSSVKTLVSLELARLSKRFTTTWVVTHIRLFTCVNPFVSLKWLFSRKHSVASFTANRRVRWRTLNNKIIDNFSSWSTPSKLSLVSCRHRIAIHVRHTSLAQSSIIQKRIFFLQSASLWRLECVQHHFLHDATNFRHCKWDNYAKN